MRIVSGKAGTCNNRLVDLFGRPATDGSAIVQENLQPPNDPPVVDFDSRARDGTDGDGHGETWHEGRVHVEVEACAWKAAKRSVMV